MLLFRIPNLDQAIAGLLMLLSLVSVGGDAYGVDMQPTTQSQLIEAFGNPLDFILVGNKKIFQYEEVEYWIEGQEIVRSRKRIKGIDTKVATTELIVMDSDSIEPPEALGVFPEEDAYIRGGRFDHIKHELLNNESLSLSGINDYIPLDLQVTQLREIQSDIRKVYLRFSLEYLPHSDSELILHTSKPWKFADFRYQKSPAIHVFAMKPWDNADVVSGNESETMAWREHQLSWRGAVGNSVVNGANLQQAVRLKSKSFPVPESYKEGIPENSELRFQLGELSRFTQPDGSITLMITHSSEDCLEVYSKDGTSFEWYRPRLVLKGKHY